ncbi:MAG: choice-of-anchor D domain-containing protein [Acidobacteriota bacterium]
MLDLPLGDAAPPAEELGFGRPREPQPVVQPPAPPRPAAPAQAPPPQPAPPRAVHPPAVQPPAPPPPPDIAGSPSPPSEAPTLRQEPPARAAPPDSPAPPGQAPGSISAPEPAGENPGARWRPEPGADLLRPAPELDAAGSPHRARAAAKRRRDGDRRGGFPWAWVLLLLLLPLAVAAGYFLRPTPPVLTLSNDLLEFGDVRVGEGASARLALRNDGQSDLELVAVEIVGDPDGAFRRLEGTCGGPLAEGATCELALAFSPTGPGDARARLRMLTNAPAAAERSVPLIGRGTAPSLELTPASLDFGEATVGERGGRGAIRVANRGSASVRVETVRLSGLAAADFIRRQDGCSGTEVAAGGDCEVSFEFVPTTDGDRRAAVEVRAAAPVASAPALRGRGLPQLPLLAMEPARLDFASLRVGRDSDPVAVALRNDGNGPLDIAGVGVIGDGAMAESFRVIDGGCAGTRLAPGSSCQLKVAFRPRSEGQLGAVVEIKHSAAPGRHRLPVVGSGTAPRFLLSARQLSFGEAAKGRQSPWRTLEVRNGGSAPLRVTGATLGGADAKAFEVSADGCVRAPIPPGQSCGVEVRFRARRDGPHRAEVELTHDASGRAGTVALNGLGTSARLVVVPQVLDFGEITLGTTRSLELQVRNDGRAPLLLGRLVVEGRGLELERDCGGRSLAAASRCAVSVRATPQQAGPVRGRLVVNQDGGPPVSVPIQLEARPRPKPVLAVDERRVAFTERYLGERSPIEVITLRNRGTARLDLREMELEGEGAADFQIVPGSCATFVAAGTSCTVGVAFSPRAPGQRLAALAIRHNAEGGLARVLLEGTGVATQP